MKIVTIGGGSSYTPELIEGFIKRYHELPITEIWLVDIKEGQEKLEIISALAKRMIKEANLPIKIYATLNRKEALKNADFVTTQIRVGQLEARMLDEAIPLKYNSIGQETNGAGGLFKGLRTIPIILEICQEMEELCKDAWLINFSNPAGMIIEALLTYSTFNKVIGLCNGPIGIEKGISKILQVEQKRIYTEFIGLNHMVFAKNIYLDGVNVTAEVIEKIIEKNTISLKNITEIKEEPEFLRSLKMIPIGYLRYYFQNKEMLEQQKNRNEKRRNKSKCSKKVEKELFELYKDPNLTTKPKQLEQRGGAYYSDAACNLISSIYNDKRDIQTINIKNNGAISDFDDNSAVEVNCVITKQGPIPITTGKLPDSIKGLVTQIKSFEKLAAKAAVTGDYKTALLALTINPLIDSDKKAKLIFDELLEAHKKIFTTIF